QSVRLESACGKLIRRARLGQLGKKKAVRLSDAAAAPGPLSGAMDMPALAPPVPSPEPLADLMPPAADIDAGPELPELPDLPDLPDLDLPSDGPGPELPDLPPVPAAADDGSLPDLPPLPDLPELPEIS
ncbi:MAG: hypothetical protein LJE62_01115, partial [Silicimonas sp.]|nr:hypothetical protein [Silicimonas sp.]